jgi:hypothetical protein
MQFGTTYVLFAATGITTFSASCPSCHVGPIPARAAFVDVKGGLMGEVFWRGDVPNGNAHCHRCFWALWGCDFLSRWRHGRRFESGGFEPSTAGLITRNTEGLLGQGPAMQCAGQ